MLLSCFVLLRYNFDFEHLKQKTGNLCVKMSYTLRSCSFKSDSTHCSFYESQKKRRKNSQTQTSYMHCLEEEIEAHFQGIQLLTDQQIIMHLKKLKNFKRHRNIVDKLKRSLNLIYNQNKKFERMLSSSDFQNGSCLFVNNSTKQKEILPLLKQLIGEHSGNSSASFPSDLLSNKNFVDSATVSTNTKSCSDIKEELSDTKDDITINNLDNFMDSDGISETSSDKTIIPNSLEPSCYDSSAAVFNTGMLSNANFILQGSESFHSDVEQQVVPNGPNLSNFKCPEKTNASLQLPCINQPLSYKKVFIFDSSSNVWRQSEYNIIGSSANSEANSLKDNNKQCNSAMTPNAFLNSDNSVFKKPSSMSMRRKVSSRPPSRKNCPEDGQKRIIGASYSSGENLSHRDYSDLLSRQKEIISDTFDEPLQTDQNADVKMTTSSISELIVNDTNSVIENESGKSCQYEEAHKGAFHLQSNEGAGAMQPFAEKEIISDSFNTLNDNSLLSEEIPELPDDSNFKMQMDSKNTNENMFKPTISSDTGALQKDKCFVYEKSQPRKQSQEKSISQLQIKPDNDSKIKSCNNRDEEVDELSSIFEKVMTLGQQHNKNNIYKKILTGVEDLRPTKDPKATLDLARKLGSTFTLQYNQMVRKWCADLMERNNAWEGFEYKMRQPLEMLLQVESVLPQVIQASSTERRLNADSEFKEYLKNIFHDFNPEDLQEVNPYRIFCDNESEIEEIAAIFRQQLKDKGCLKDPDTQLDNEEHFEGVVQMLNWRIIEDFDDKLTSLQTKK